MDPGLDPKHISDPATRCGSLLIRIDNAGTIHKDTGVTNDRNGGGRPGRKDCVPQVEILELAERPGREGVDPRGGTHKHRGYQTGAGKPQDRATPRHDLVRHTRGFP
jgi:hypothetical protein